MKNFPGVIFFISSTLMWTTRSLFFFTKKYPNGINVFSSEYLLQKEETINKVTSPTQLAQDNKLVETFLPSWCQDFKDVFSENTHDQLPPHCSFDHTIELKPSFVPQITKVYPLNSKEQETCQSFINEHLKTGHIHSSKSLQAALFFFVSKKDSFLHPCQDYCYLNLHTICNTYPLPLIPKLINNMKNTT